MNKVILSLLAFAFLFAKPAFAGSLSVKLSQPKTPTRINSFNITFVALDTEDIPVTVKCLKKSPTDSDFVQFGSDFVLSNGGNTDNCVVNSSVITGQGTYQFKVSASDGGPTFDSNVVSVEYKTDGPSTPVSYSKEKINDCTWKIKFKTAADGGKTSKVEVYRSDNTSFNADSGNMFASISVASDQEGEASLTVPDCAKTWYFAVRAFDNAGNGSGILGDTQDVTITVNPTTSSTSNNGGAIALASGAGSSVGEAKPEAENPTEVSPTGEAAGENGQPEIKGAESNRDSKLFYKILGGASLLGLLYVIFFKKRKK